MENKKLNFTELAVLTMELINRPATTTELWAFVLQNNLHRRLKAFDETTQAMTGKTPEATFGRNIYIETDIFEAISGTKPKQFVLRQQKPDNRLPETVGIEKKPAFRERDLHQVLSYFLKHSDYFQAYSKTIFHEESAKGQKGEDKWLYPDMVAVNFEYADYHKNNVLNFIEKFDIRPIKVFSFELKKELNYSNYKEYFFQAVSNSSWANEGYLVAPNIK